MDSESLADAYLDALDTLWRDRGNDDPGYKAMLPFAKRIRELQAECNEQARLNAMGAEREARLMAQVAELQAERDALAKDAARYRWLHVAENYPDMDWWANKLSNTRTTEKFDATVDAAMAEG